MEIVEFIKLGYEHIIDINGVDHILFVATLCSLYYINEWKKMLWLVTAFTLGHCVTLALSSFRLVNISPNLVETLIPITIILTALYNIYMVSLEKKDNISIRWHYLSTFFFGLIHGLGFSNFFKELFGADEQIWIQLLGFNIGVEIGQLLVVLGTTLIGYFISQFGENSKKMWTIAIAVSAIGKSILLLFG